MWSVVAVVEVYDLWGVCDIHEIPIGLSPSFVSLVTRVSQLSPLNGNEGFQKQPVVSIVSAHCPHHSPKGVLRITENFLSKYV